ncbi:MAG: DUF5043 domain-containing protein [Tidjanibacter sp.]|nr:DUF5043 domain-containing protein [Tidjanibacter sp.]
MKNIMLLVSILMLSAFAAEAQNYYYNGPTAVGDSVTYNIKVAVGPVIELSNINNRYDKIEQIRLDGKTINSLDVKRYSAKNEDATDNAVRAAFDAEHVQWFYEGDEPRPTIILIVDPNSGDVIEVRFMFNNETRWGTVSPNYFYRLEQEIKRNVKIVVTGDDKNYNYLSLDS